MTDTITTIVGNLTAAPELRWTPSGVPVANFTVASTPRTFDKQRNEWVDGEALFMRCQVWREAAENAAATLGKGMRVIVLGKLEQRSYETREGEKRTVIEMKVDEVGPSVRYATAQVTKTPRGGGQQRQQQPQQGGWGGQQQPPADDPWGTTTPDDTEPPF